MTLKLVKTKEQLLVELATENDELERLQKAYEANPMSTQAARNLEDQADKVQSIILKIDILVTEENEQ